MQVKEIKYKHEQICLEKYGTLTPLENKEIFTKTQKSFNEHYGTENGISELRQVRELNDKISNTNIIRYGGVSPFCSFDVRATIKETMYANGTCATSKKQRNLCEMIKEIYGNCELNYPCDELSLDCMTIINGIHFDIEYDGWYWHKDRKKEDLRRDFFVESQGYKVIRIKAYEDRLPTKEEIADAINYILTTNKNFTYIELNKN